MIPEKLKADCSEKYEVSIRFTLDGLSFSGYIPTEKDSFFSEVFRCDKNLPVIDALKQFFFTSPCLSYPYRVCCVVNVSGKYILTPDTLFQEKEKARLFHLCHPKDDSLKILACPVRSLNVFLTYGMEEAVYQFLVRSLVEPRFIHALSPVLNYWQKKSQMLYPKQMHAMIREDRMDIVCFQEGELLFANSFHIDSDSDMIYYIMYICRQTGFSQLDDYLTISGQSHRCERVLSAITDYVRHATYYQPLLKDHPSTLGQCLPMDTVALVECGL
jgi:hypothetical protein